MFPKSISAIIKLSVICNYNCEFCYYTHHKPKRNALLPFELFEKVLRAIVEYNIKNNVFTVHYVLHGGEPLLVGIDYLKKIIELEKSLKKEFTSISFTHSIQTNSFLMTDDIMKFLVDNDFCIGISLDGDIDLNYHYGRNGVSECTQIAISNINKLQNMNAKVGVLSVITEKNSNYAKKYYKFLVDNNIHNIGLCPCVNDEIDKTISSKALIRFYKELFDLYFFEDYKLSIREFDSIISNILGYNVKNVCTSCNRNSCGKFISIDTEGNVFFCDNAYEKENAIGNIVSNSFEEIFESPIYIEQYKNARRIINNKCLNCSIYTICRGGCYRNDIIIDDKISNHFCEVYTYIKQMVDIFSNNENGGKNNGSNNGN